VREGAVLFDGRGHKIGKVTSGTIGPTIDQPIAMAYVDAPHAHPAAEVFAEVRGRKLPMRITALPFVPHRYHRG
jgi:aminomethyltransferase